MNEHYAAATSGFLSLSLITFNKLTMKFILNTASSLPGRLGKITEIHRLPGISFETPLFMVHTRGGSVPNITYEVLQMAYQEPLSMQVPLPGVLHNESVVRDFKKGLAEFIGLKEYLIYCTVQDSAEVIASGFNDKNTISVFTRQGREQIDPERYMDTMETFCPDMYQALHDGDTSKESSKKRITNAVTRTLSFTQSCLKRHSESKVLQSKAILGVIEGGYDTAAREQCVQALKDLPFSGFVIDGLHNGGPSVEEASIDDVKPIIEKTLKCLPPDKFRVIHGCYNPEVVLDLVELGVDIFDGSYPYTVSERGSALVFSNQLCSSQNCADDNNVEQAAKDGVTDDVSEKTNCEINLDNNTEQAAKDGVAEDVREKTKYGLYFDNNIGQAAKDGVAKDVSEKRKYEMNLKNKRYYDDFQPISNSCSCLTCKDHTRSYIHHLVMTKELLGTVLLTIHNLHHYSEFFKTIRKALEEDKWQDFRKYFRKGNGLA